MRSIIQSTSQVKCSAAPKLNSSKIDMADHWISSTTRPNADGWKHLRKSHLVDPSHEAVVRLCCVLSLHRTDSATCVHAARAERPFGPIFDGKSIPRPFAAQKYCPLHVRLIYPDHPRESSAPKPLKKRKPTIYRYYQQWNTGVSSGYVSSLILQRRFTMSYLI
jgi:hypothetical protein